MLFHVHAPVGPEGDALAFELGALLGPSRGSLPDAVHDTMAGKRLVIRGLCHCPAYPPGVLRSSRQRGDPAVGEYFSPRDLPGDLVHVVEKFP